MIVSLPAIAVPVVYLFPTGTANTKNALPRNVSSFVYRSRNLAHRKPSNTTGCWLPPRLPIISRTFDPKKQKSSKGGARSGGVRVEQQTLKERFGQFERFDGVEEDRRASGCRAGRRSRVEALFRCWRGRGEKGHRVRRRTAPLGFFGKGTSFLFYFLIKEGGASRNNTHVYGVYIDFQRRPLS